MNLEEVITVFADNCEFCFCRVFLHTSILYPLFSFWEVNALKSYSEKLGDLNLWRSA